MVENLSGRKVKTLHTDNGGEYTSREFELYLTREGISPRDNHTSHTRAKWGGRKANSHTHRGSANHSKLPQRF